jgi:hypothetical protein
MEDTNIIKFKGFSVNKETFVMMQEHYINEESEGLKEFAKTKFKEALDSGQLTNYSADFFSTRSVMFPIIFLELAAKYQLPIGMGTEYKRVKKEIEAMFFKPKK